jgi:hypothetical protein
MSSPAPSEDNDAHSPEGWERALLDRQLERLDELADMGMALARDIQRRAIAADPDADITHAAIDFARVSRAVRMTLALQSRLVRDFKTPVKAGSAKADNDDVRWDVQWIDEDCSREVRDSVRRVAEDSGLDAETAERLAAEAYERMERDDVYTDVMTRSFDEIVAAICRDLGLSLTGATSPVYGGGGPRSGGEGIQTQGGFDGAAETLEMRHALSTTFGGPPLPPAGEVASPQVPP